MIHWIPVETEEELQQIYQADTVAAIFKHSTTCGISGMAKRNLERMASLSDKDVNVYYLDLLRFRPLSNQIAQLWHVEHQSPQLIIVKGKENLFDASHGDIDFDDLIKRIG